MCLPLGQVCESYLAMSSLCDRKCTNNLLTGIRPLVRDPNSKNTESLVRNHLVNVSKSGLLTCAGGKWTTYRQMAEDAVDEAVKVFNLKTRRPAQTVDISGSYSANDDALLNGSCQTQRLRLIGSHGYSKTLFINLIQHFGLEADVAQHLTHSYGDRAWEVAALASQSTEATPRPVRGQRLSPQYPFIDGEVRYAVQREYAETAVDVLARRTRLSFLDAQAALQALPKVIDTMAEELQWNQARKDLEWTETVYFLGSMGLPATQMMLTREDVLSGKQQQQQQQLTTSPAVAKDKQSSPSKPIEQPMSVEIPMGGAVVGQ